MKTFLFLLGIGLALAIPSEIKPSKVRPEKEIVIKKHYPEVITEFEEHNYAKLPIEELIKVAAEHEGLEFLNDVDAIESMGIDPLNLDPELIEDALSTTVR